MRFLSTLFFSLLAFAQLMAQAASESPYSDQSYDPPANSSWYSDPLVTGGMILVAGIIVLYIWKKK